MDKTFTQPALPYSYDALEPYLDAKTMEVHYAKHHATYTQKFNEALQGISGLDALSAPDILKKLDLIPEAKRQTVINHGGGYVNHNIYWEIICPGGKELTDAALIGAINRDFGSLEQFKREFTEKAMSVFGSGWTWLVKDNQTEKLSVKRTSFQDNPVSKIDVTPILTVDVWEHAYYLKHMNRRDNYLNDWWNVVNWEAVAQKFNS